MRARRQVSAVKAIVEVRRLQEQAAEMAVAKAAGVLHEAQATRDAQANVLAAAQKDWARTLGDPALGLSVAALWASQVARSEADLIVASAQVQSAEERRQLRSEEWRRALTRAQAADKVATTVVRIARRAREESALNELADRTARGVRPS